MRNLLISFSGGETSSYMTIANIEKWRKEYENIAVVFANTGQENEQTLEFIERCDKENELGVVWVEAVVYHGERKGTSFKIVDFETACRSGVVFEDVIKKYGIPNHASPHCTRELKLRPITAYIKNMGWGDYDTAIGIRIDEIDRIDKNALTKNFIYPLCDSKTTKADINDYWKSQRYRLVLLEHQGNCKWCWKKSLKKLLTIAKESPDFFYFPARMEREYSHHVTSTSTVYNDLRFFRGHRSALDILELSKQPFEQFTDKFREETELSGSCSESCEAFTI